MIRRLVLLALLFPMPAAAAERSIGVGSFDKVRVQGAFEVTIAPGPPRAIVSGPSDALDRVAVTIEGTTLTVRAAAAARDGPVPAVRLTTPRVSALLSLAGARVTAARMAGERIDLSITGGGEIAVDTIAAREVAALLVGTGAMRIGGSAGRVRLVASGSGRIDAAALRADELTVRMDGSGEILAQARYGATVSSTGAGRIDIAGEPKCTVRSGGGPVRCGRQAAR